MKLSDELSRQPFALRGWHILQWRLRGDSKAEEAVVLAERAGNYGKKNERVREWVTAWVSIETFRLKPIGGLPEWSSGNYFSTYAEALANYDARCGVTPDCVADAG